MKTTLAVLMLMFVSMNCFADRIFVTCSKCGQICEIEKTQPPEPSTIIKSDKYEGDEYGIKMALAIGRAYTVHYKVICPKCGIVKEFDKTVWY